MRLLLAEDEASLSRALVKILEHANYSVDAVDNGEDALAALTAGDYDAAVLDIMMPKMDGLTVLSRLREQGSRVPVMLLTAKAEVDDKVRGLDCGADDYLTKPFAVPELLARIRAMTRTQSSAGNVLTAGNISLNRSTFDLSSGKGSYRLANREFQIMELLMNNPHQLISAERMLEKIWGYESEADVSVVWVYISYLRKKLAALDADIQIKATRNAGYSLETRNG